MSIRAKLTISMLLQIILVITVGLVLTSSLEATNRINAKNVHTAKINAAITEMRFITFEHLLHHNARSLEQWQLKYQTLAALMAPTPANTPAERQILADMTSQHQAVKSLFDRLTTSYQETAASPDTPTGLQSFQDRLTGQLLVKQQTQIAAAAQLAALGRAEIATQHVNSFWLILGVILLMLAITAANSWVVITSITTSLAPLQQGAAALAAGNLDYRIPRRSADEFSQLAAAFNSMAASLKQIDQTKSEFILMVSHQLRTPATAVKGFLSMLLDGYMGKLPAKQTATLQDAFAENQRQLQLVDEILVIAQAETGEMVLYKTPTDLARIIDDIITAQSPTLQERSQTISLVRPPTPDFIRVDADKIRLVIENLITNAITYSPEHSHIEVTLKTSATEATIQVTDPGFGISEQDQDKLFQKFSRLSNTGQVRIEGAGLGLYLAKKIMDLHRGKILVTSRPGRGSTFTIVLSK